VVELEGVVIFIYLLNEEHAENLINGYGFLKIMFFWYMMYSSKQAPYSWGICCLHFHNRRPEDKMSSPKTSVSIS
jgi:hypothetical protein